LILIFVDIRTERTMSSIKVNQDCVEPEAGPSTVSSNDDHSESSENTDSEDSEKQPLDIVAFLQRIESDRSLRMKYDRGIVTYMRYSDMSLESLKAKQYLQCLNMTYFRAYLKKLHPNYEDAEYRFKTAIEQILANEVLKGKCEKALHIYERRKNISYYSLAKLCKLPLKVLTCYLKYTHPELKDLEDTKKPNTTVTAEEIIANPTKYSQIKSKLDEAIKHFLTKNMGSTRVADKFSIKHTLLVKYMSLVVPDYKEKRQQFMEQLEVIIMNYYYHISLTLRAVICNTLNLTD
jgi:hypothetical protein